MANRVTLHKLRQSIAMKRQQRHKQNLLDLDDELSKLGLSDPYSLTGREWASLGARCKAFATGAKGRPVNIPKHYKFLYRLCDISSLIKFTDWKATLEKTLPNKQVLSRLVEDYNRNKTWLPLNQYASGILKGYRELTWWTTMEIPIDLQPVKLIQLAHRLGLINLWIPPHTVILRCSVPYINARSSSRVPTVLDGFASPIFHPACCNNKPSSGLTINLEHTNVLLEGEQEFALGPIDVSAIDFYPIYIGRNARTATKSVKLTPELYKALENYYNKLLS